MNNFLESDFFCNGRILIFGINRIQSEPTVNHILAVDRHVDQFKSFGINQVVFVSFGDFLLFDQLMPKLSKNTLAYQVDQNALLAVQQLLGKRGHQKFLQDYWQFACIINQKSVEYYIEQEFKARKIGPDTKENIYSNVGPEKVLDYLTRGFNDH